MKRTQGIFTLTLVILISTMIYVNIFQSQPTKNVTWRAKLKSLYEGVLQLVPLPTSLETRKNEWQHYSDIAKNKTKIKRLPDVVGIGVKKCGTDAVISFLLHHPFVKVPDNVETFFFNNRYKKGLDWYRNLMPEVAEHEIIMEKTPGYFVSPPINLPERLYHDIPTAKLILVVCDPVKRSFSDYTHERARYEISSSSRMVAQYDTFDSYLDVYIDKVNRSISFDAKATLSNVMSNYYEDRASTLLATGFYSVYLPRWTDLFNSSQVLILSGEDLLKNPGPEVEKMQNFLGIPKLIRASDFVKNPTNGLYCVRPWWKNYNYTAEVKEIAGWEENLDCLAKTKGRTRHKHGQIGANQKNLARLRLLYKPFNEEFYRMTGIDFNKAY